MQYNVHSGRSKRNVLHVHNFLKHTTITTFYFIFEIDYWWILYYGVARIRRLLKMIDLFCKRAQWKRRYSVKETCNCKEPTNCSHPIRYPQCAIKKKVYLTYIVFCKTLQYLQCTWCLRVILYVMFENDYWCIL